MIASNKSMKFNTNTLRVFVFTIMTTLLAPALHVSRATPKRMSVVVDLGGVLIHTDKHASAKLIGIGTLMGYVFSHFKSPRDLYFPYLNDLKKLTDMHPAVDEHGNPMPQLMCDWLKGTIPPTAIRDGIIDSLKNTDHSNNEREVITNMATMMFTPEQFITTQELSEKGLEFIKNLIAQGHDVYILSNWEPESAKLVVQKYPELFSLCKGIVFSGDVGMIKPDPAIYHHVLNTFNLNANECFFIDDQELNVKAAQSIGMHGAVYKGGRFKNVGNTLVAAQEQARWQVYNTLRLAA